MVDVEGFVDSENTRASLDHVFKEVDARTVIEGWPTSVLIICCVGCLIIGMEIEALFHPFENTIEWVDNCVVNSCYTPAPKPVDKLGKLEKRVMELEKNG